MIQWLVDVERIRASRHIGEVEFEDLIALISWVADMTNQGQAIGR